MNYYSYKEEEISFIKYVDPLNIAKKLCFNEISNIIKIVVILKGKEHIKEHILQKLYSFKDIDIFFHEQESIIYINPFNTNKGSTLKELLREDYICFGNDKNDIEMFKGAIYGVQVGDYYFLKNYADEIIQEKDVARKIRTIVTKIKKY